MKGHWKHLLVQATIWVIAEVVLNVAGLDNLADYGEFVFGREFTWHGTAAVTLIKPSY